MTPALGDLRRLAVARSLFEPTSLQRALNRLGFVQADPIRAPARAQDLILRLRVRDYRAGDLERRYGSLPIEEDVFVNYGFVTRRLQALMHPRGLAAEWPAGRRRRVQRLLDFVRERGPVHPRDVDSHFAHGTVTNYWGGSSNATTHLLELMHYAGLLRVARREAGIRIYAIHEHGNGPASEADRHAHLDALVDTVVQKYAPLPAASLSTVVHRLRYAVPQWQSELKAALIRATRRLRHARVDGVDWYWPAADRLSLGTRPSSDETVRLLAPFDPLVWDRRRFEMLWAWAYRFEAYTPTPKRKLGYYALPLLWRDHIIGWANLSLKAGVLQADFGYVASRAPRDRTFARALDAELDRMRRFLSVEITDGELPDRRRP